MPSECRKTAGLPSFLTLVSLWKKWPYYWYSVQCDDVSPAILLYLECRGVNVMLDTRSLVAKRWWKEQMC